MIAPALQHAVDLMNDSHHHVATTHSLIHAEQLSKSDEMVASHRTNNFQVMWSVGIDRTCTSSVYIGYLRDMWLHCVGS